MNALSACASPLFALISRIRNRAQHVDPDKLRQSVVAEVRAFENRALQAGIVAQNVKVARYALCATLDDVVLNTPWGGQSGWAMQSMVGTFHRETVGGDRFYDLLARLEKDPGAKIEMLEFLYSCLSLGFEGRLRVEDRGSEKHLAIRNSLARIIRGQLARSSAICRRTGRGWTSRTARCRPGSRSGSRSAPRRFSWPPPMAR
jgi:type VI secretion system protein ImpK